MEIEALGRMRANRGDGAARTKEAEGVPCNWVELGTTLSSALAARDIPLLAGWQVLQVGGERSAALPPHAKHRCV